MAFTDLLDNANDAPPAGSGMGATDAEGTQESTTELPRFDIPAPDTSIDTTNLASGAPTKAAVEEIAPPEDIDAANIGAYTPYQETLGTVDAESTVEGRLGGLLSQNNPYIDRARTEAAQLANRRGMLNTSMAAGAAEGAAIDRALPIAQQDARAHLEQQFLNQGYSNEAAKHLADSSIQRENLAAGFEQETNQFNAAQQFQAATINQQAAQRASEQYAAEQNKNNFAMLSADLQGQLKGIDNELAMGLETLTREYGLLENMDSINGSIYQQMVQEIGTILAQPDVKVSEANAKINKLIQSAGIEMEFANGMTMGQTYTPPPPPPPRESTSSSSSGGGPFNLGGTGRGDGSCFTADTMVTMADGSEKQICDVEIGEVLLGMDGEENVVLRFDRPVLGKRAVFSFNGGKPFVTHEHPFMTSKGWKSLSPHATKEENAIVEVDLLMVGDYLEQIGNPLIRLDSIEKHDFDPETPLYNFYLSGNNTYYADGYLVHNKGPGGQG